MHACMYYRIRCVQPRCILLGATYILKPLQKQNEVLFRLCHVCFGLDETDQKKTISPLLRIYSTYWSNCSYYSHVEPLAITTSLPVTKSLIHSVIG